MSVFCSLTVNNVHTEIDNIASDAWKKMMKIQLTNVYECQIFNL